MRSTSEEPNDYKRFRSVFEESRHSKVVSPSKLFMSVSPGDALIIINRSEARNCSVSPRDVVLVQIDMRTLVESDTSERTYNSPYLSNLSLSGQSWEAPFRPAIILKKEVNNLKEGRYSLWLVPLTNLTTESALSLKEFDVDHLPKPFCLCISLVRSRYILALVKHTPKSFSTKQ